MRKSERSLLAGVCLTSRLTASFPSLLGRRKEKSRRASFKARISRPLSGPLLGPEGTLAIFPPQQRRCAETLGPLKAKSAASFESARLWASAIKPIFFFKSKKPC